MSLFEQYRAFVLGRELIKEGYEKSYAATKADEDLLVRSDMEIQEMYTASRELNTLKKKLFYVPSDSSSVLDDVELNTIRAAHGLALVGAEFNELVEAVGSMDRVNMAEEIGDQLFGLQILADAAGLTLEQCMQVNMVKLAARPRVDGTGKRDTKLERQLMEEALK